MSTSSPKPSALPNLGKIGDAHLALVPKLDVCQPGLLPTEYNVVIAPAVMPKQVGSILLPDMEKDRMEMALQVGRIVSMSPIAFNYDRWPDDAERPQVGQIVWYARFAGGLFEGADGREYRMVKDKDIGAIIIEPPAEADQNGEQSQ